MIEKILYILLAVCVVLVLPTYLIIRKIVRKQKENVILNNEYRKAKAEQKKDSK